MHDLQQITFPVTVIHISICSFKKEKGSVHHFSPLFGDTL